jgi:hypothetical protein
MRKMHKMLFAFLGLSVIISCGTTSEASNSKVKDEERARARQQELVTRQYEVENQS